jgi:hypothetical protein
VLHYTRTAVARTAVQLYSCTAWSASGVTVRLRFFFETPPVADHCRVELFNSSLDTRSYEA